MVIPHTCQKTGSSRQNQDRAALHLNKREGKCTSKEFVFLHFWVSRDERKRTQHTFQMNLCTNILMILKSQSHQQKSCHLRTIPRSFPCPPFSVQSEFGPNSYNRHLLEFDVVQFFRSVNDINSLGGDKHDYDIHSMDKGSEDKIAS